ncbi:MAG: 30S ribosomal protein S17 [Candidatus Omnitrophica bacterium]|nr:30S ribosomal protein S17 [Candidatus Omnitrophota bacterium]
MVGTVTSDKMDKAIVIQVEEHKRHSKYQKFVKGYKKIKARDEKEEAGIGDTVKIAETRPLSREICWKLVEIIVKAERG